MLWWPFMGYFWIKELHLKNWHVISKACWWVFTCYTCVWTFSVSFTVSLVRFWVSPLDQQFFLGLCIYDEGRRLKCGKSELPQIRFCVWSVLVAVVCGQWVAKGLPYNIKVWALKHQQLFSATITQKTSEHAAKKKNNTQTWSCKRGLKPWMSCSDHSITGKCVERLLTWQLPWNPSCHQLEWILAEY